MWSRQCSKDSFNCFCFVCGHYLSNKGRKINDTIKSQFLLYFGFEALTKDSWIPENICESCRLFLSKWESGTNSLVNGLFYRPMVWKEPKDCTFDCYKCLTKFTGFGKRKKIIYPQKIRSVIFPIPHTNDHPVPQTPNSLENASASDIDEVSNSQASTRSFVFSECDKFFQQPELNDLVRDLGLSKEQSELLASRLNEKSLLANDTRVCFYRSRESEYRIFFASQNDTVFCSDISGLLTKVGLPSYSPDEWRLFIDSSKRSLKCVLLNNGNSYAPVPIGHSVRLNETYDNIKTVLELINYERHQWKLCVDIKMVNFLLGQQSGFTKYPCFLCLWDSRAREEHWSRKEWPPRVNQVIGEKNIINQPLVTKDKIVFPPLHIKLGLMKQFVKALSTESECFRYIVRKFPALSYEKIKNGVFDGPQIRTLVKDKEFTDHMTPVEKEAWLAFVIVIKQFLGNKRVDNYEQVVNLMLKSFSNLGCNMNVKTHFLFSHLDQFPENLGDMSEEQGERFHQDLKVFEDRYQGRWDRNMMADYCWSITRECPNKPHARLSKKRKFLPSSFSVLQFVKVSYCL